MSPSEPRRQAERRGLRPIGLVLALVFIGALCLSAVVFYIAWELLGAHEVKAERRIGSHTLFDLAKLSFGVVIGAAALVVLVLAYRRQRIDEDGALREAARLHSERFTTAVSLLGDDSCAARLGGVHALGRLADEAPTRALRQACVEVLCAYLRLPYTAETDLPDGDPHARRDYLALRAVRHTVIRLIRDHLTPSICNPAHSWQGFDFDFTGATFDGGDFSGADFTDGTVDFREAHFADGTLNFRGAHFYGATIDFRKAHFSGDVVCFRSVIESGSIDFSEAHFSSGTVNFGGAGFYGGNVDFRDAHFSGGTVDFRKAQFRGRDTRAVVLFSRATFASGTVDFGSALIWDAIPFREADFSGSTLDFREARFLGDLIESDASVIDFHRAAFSGGTLDFREADFSGETSPALGETYGSKINFREATFSGSTLDFSSARGPTPIIGPLPEHETALPAGLLLPPHWLPAP